MTIEGLSNKSFLFILILELYCPTVSDAIIDLFLKSLTVTLTTFSMLNLRNSSASGDVSSSETSIYITIFFGLILCLKYSVTVVNDLSLLRRIFSCAVNQCADLSYHLES